MEQIEANIRDPWYFKRCRENPYFFSPDKLNYEMKVIAVRACQSVASICFCVDGIHKFNRSGFVVESTIADGEYINTIFTSACILRHYADAIAVPSRIEISVILSEGTSCIAELVGYDFHYNIAAIKMKTQMPMAQSRLKEIDDSISLDPNFVDQRDRFRLFPGDTVMALGRCCHNQMDILIVSGKFSVTQTGFDCENLLRAECKINRCGIGGALINRCGEVIGMNFLADDFTPFLPINIISLWWEDVKKNGHCIIPRHGLKLKNFYLYELDHLELVMRTFPNTFTGVVVGVVVDEIEDKLDSLDCSASSTKILRSDIIVECDGKPVGSALEFLELIWDKAGTPVRLTLLRPFDASRLHVTITVGNVGQNQLNRWSLPELKNRMKSFPRR